MPTPFGFGNVLTLALRPEWLGPDPRLVRSLTSTPAIASAASRPPYAAGMTSPAPHTRLSDYREHSDEYNAESREPGAGSREPGAGSREPGALARPRSPAVA